MSRGRKPQRKAPQVKWERVGSSGTLDAEWVVNIYSYDHHELNKAKNVFHYTDNKLNHKSNK